MHALPLRGERLGWQRKRDCNRHSFFNQRKLINNCYDLHDDNPTKSCGGGITRLFFRLYNMCGAVQRCGQSYAKNEEIDTKYSIFTRQVIIFQMLPSAQKSPSYSRNLSLIELFCTKQLLNMHR